jgi:hypothetical protein
MDSTSRLRLGKRNTKRIEDCRLMVVDLRSERKGTPSKLSSKIQIQQSSIGNQSRFPCLGISGTEL